MSSEQLGAAQNVLKGNLGGAWDITNGYQDAYTDLGIARRFGGSAAAYSLRDIGAMNGRVVKVRRDLAGEENDAEEDFSASQVQSGALEDWVNGKLENLLPASPDEIKAVTVTGGAEVADTYVAGTGFTNGRSVYTSTTLATPAKFVFTASNPRWIIQKVSDNSTLVNSTTTGEGELYPTKIQNVGTYFSGTGTKEVTGITAGVAAAAAYSLRKINSSYSGNAVRIRRSSDDVEVDVAFDSDDKVSASSAITNVAEQGGESGSTNATDLNGFLNESVSGFIATSYAGIDASYKHFTSDPTISNTAFSGANGGTQSRLTYQNPFGYLVSASDFDGCKVKVTGTVNTLSGGNITVKPNTQSNGGGSWTPSEGTKVLSTSGSFEYIFTGNGTNSFKSVAFLIDASTTVDVSNLTFEVIEHGATVHTWYDQAGSNNAVQTTAANQPKIAENGALLADGVDFDGSNDFLESTSLSSIYTGTDTVSSSFILVHSDAASTTQYIIGAGSTSAGNPMYNTLFHGGGNIGWQARDDAGTLKSNLSATPYVANQMYLVSNINSGTTTDFNSNAVIKDNGADSDVGSKTINTVKLGALGNGSSSPLNGSIKEAIFYASDQSNNRFRIESNINNYYSLYNDELFFNGNVTPFTTASTITKSDGTTATVSSGVVVSTGLKNSIKYTISGETSTGNRFTQFRLSDLGVDTVYPMANGEFIYFSATVESDTSDGLDFVIDIRDGFTSLTNNSQHANARGTISGRLTRNSTAGDSGGDTCIMIQTSGVANATVHLTNIKLSQIQRNGFVPTWYDQSGNSRPLIQTNASEQPSIVENGSFLGAIKAEVATSNDTMQNLQVSTDGTNANFGTDDWADGGTKLGLIYVGSIVSSVSTSNPAVIWGGGRGVSSFQSGGVSLQIIKSGADSTRLRNERQGLTPSGMTAVLSGEVTGDAVIYGTADNRDFKIKVNDNSATDTEAADLDVREETALSLFGAYGGDNGRYYERSASGNCKECYLFSGDNITEIDTIATEINDHYNIY